MEIFDISDQEIQSGRYGMLVCWYVGMLVCWYVGMNTIHKIYIGELRGFDSETNDLFL